MKKGDMKKQEIIRTAERMFCKNGYANTSVQDIIDELHTSKGSFYHHFVSKESLLEEICRIRAADASNRVSITAESIEDPLDRLNLLLKEMIPLTGEKLSFLLMLLPVFLTQEGAVLRSFYSTALGDYYMAPISSVLKEGTEKGVFFCRDEDFYANMAIITVNSMWIRICDMILLNEENSTVTDPSDLMAILAQYRTALERLLMAPYGTLELFSLPEMYSLISQIHQHWKKTFQGS